MEYNYEVKAKENETYTDEGVFPETRIKDYASTEQINYTLRSTESPEHNDDVRTEEQEKCKGDDINNDTSPETRIIDELINHLQDHYDSLKRDKPYKIENGMQIEEDVRFLELEELSRKNISRKGEKDSGIEDPKSLEYIPDPKAAKTEFTWTIPQ